MPNPRRFINRALVQRGAREERAKRMASLAQTTWGQAWLGALRSADQQNRLGRGMELARQGAVEGLRFGESGTIAAEVMGSRGFPYEARIELAPFGKTQTETIVLEVARRPEWLDLLLNAQLPAGIQQVLKTHKIDLFPELSAMRMSCSCPDTAVPCKHLAATLYQLAADIDDSPTLLFSMRGLDLAADLGALSQLDGLAPTALRDLQIRRPSVTSEEDLENAEFSPQRSELSQQPDALPPKLELPQPASLLEYWALLLPARPPFFRDGNLAGMYLAYLARAAALWTGSDAEPEEDQSGAETFAVPEFGLPDIAAWQAHEIRIVLDAAGGFARAEVLDGQGVLLHTFAKEVQFLAFLERLERRPNDAPHLQRGLVMLAFRLARRLAVSSAVVPRLLSLGGDDYRVRWEPATQDASVADAVRQLARHPQAETALRYVERVYEAESEDALRARLGQEIEQVLEDSHPSKAPSFRAEQSEAEKSPSAAGGSLRASSASSGLSRDDGPRQSASSGLSRDDGPRQSASSGLSRDDGPRQSASSGLSRDDGPRQSASSGLSRDDGPREYAPLPSDALNALLGTLLRPMLLAGVEEVLAKAEYTAVQLLFLGRPVSFANAGDSELALAIPLWLKRLRLDTSSHRILLQVDELDGAPGRYALRPLLVIETSEAPEPVPLALVSQADYGELLRLQVMRDMAVLAEAYTPLQAFVSEDRAVVEFIELYGSDFARFLFEVAPALRLVGAQVLMPRGLEQAARPKLSAVVVAGDGSAEGLSPKPTKSEKPKGLLGLNSLVAFDWRVAVGEELISADEFADLTDKYEGIVRLRDGFVWLEPLQTSRLLQRLANPPQPSAAVTVQAVLTNSFQGAPLLLSAEVERLRQNLLAAGSQELVDLPGLHATLRPYQVEGFRWLLRNAEAGLGSLLADDMGLGKTLQTIALLEHYRALGRWETAPVLIVLPTSLITNWTRELARFAPELSVVTYHGPNRKLRVLAQARTSAAGTSSFRKPEVVLTSYGIVRSDIAKLVKLEWGAIIIDEAQQIKNPGAAQSEAVKRLDAPLKMALSGTPVENRLSEYWSVLDFANPGYLGPLEQFKALYADPIERDRDEAALERFRQITMPFILRRLKTDRSVIQDLPDKITQIEPCHLEPEQAALYQQVVETQLRELAAADETMRRARMLKFMTAVKQVCNHPYHYLKRGSRDAEASGKAQRLIELTEAALASEERVLIFTQYRQMGELLADMLRERFGYRPPFLHGGLQREERDAMVAGMQDGTGAPILILSIKAGGTGLNLTAANHVIHYDLWWNPAVESQATDRAYRIGQARNVHVHRLITAGTFEERIDMMLSQKRELAELTVGSGGAWLGDLDLRSLL